MGGKEGSTNIVITQPDGENPEKHSKLTHHPLEGGNVISFRTGGGGGYGDPLERDKEAVLTDVLLGYVSEEKARTEYGVVLTPDKKNVDEAQTQIIRANLRKR